MITKEKYAHRVFFFRDHARGHGTPIVAPTHAARAYGQPHSAETRVCSSRRSGGLSSPGYPGYHPCPAEGAAIQSHKDQDQGMLQRRTVGVRHEGGGEAELH